MPSDPFKDWLARAERDERLAAVQASYGHSAGGRGHSASTQLKFLDIIRDLDPQLVKPKTALTNAPRNDKRQPLPGGPSLLTAALKEHKTPQGTQSSKTSDSKPTPPGTVSR
ncbi:hypothetical protein AURDEDRAFT_164069 [Auricularia subglabra TFB-10046 SS5]|nr:hypothetical protein AURDEDRAFT_164069 [Auricularia subglabra TFB-10046 SS5]